MEEAPLTLKTWFNQRARWIKGHIMTYITHFKNCLSLSNKKFTIGLHYSMGLLPILQLFTPIGFTITFLYFFDLIHFPYLQSQFIMKLSLFSLITRIVFNIFTIYKIFKDKRLKHLSSFLLLPLYLLLQSFAAYYALYQLITSPHSWSKTPHGVTSLKNRTFNKF